LILTLFSCGINFKTMIKKPFTIPVVDMRNDTITFFPQARRHLSIKGRS